MMRTNDHSAYLSSFVFVNVGRLFGLALIASFLTTASAQSNWGQFRGESGLGVAPAADAPPLAIDPTHHQRWRFESHLGHSSPCIWGDHLFFTQEDEDQLTTICLNRHTGDLLWSKSESCDTPERIHEINSLASPTTVTNGEYVVSYFGSYGLICFDIQGDVIWRRPIEYKGNTFGTAASPVMVGDRLVFCCDRREESYLEVLDLKTGDPIWRKERTGFGSGWSTPMIWERDGALEVVIYGVWELKAYSLEDGTEHWMIPGLTDEPCITPVNANGIVYVTSYNMKTNQEVIGLPTFAQLLEQYDQNDDGVLSPEEAESNESVLSRFDADGEGDHPLSIFFRFLDEDRDQTIEADEWPKIVNWVDSFAHENALLAISPNPDAPTNAEVLWKYERGVPEIPSPLVLNDCVYLIKNGGILTCLDATTGSRHYQKRLTANGPYYASPIACGGHIYFASARGTITIVEEGPEGNVLHECDLGERIMSTPAIVDNSLYVRTDSALYCFGADEEQEQLPVEVTSLLGDELRQMALSNERRIELESNLQQALDDFEQDPDNVDNAIWYARRLAYLWRYRDAVDVLSEAIDQHPDEPRLYRHRGHRYITLRDFESAKRDLLHAAELMEGTDDQIEPDGAPNAAGIPTSTLHTNVWYHLGLAHYLLGEYEAAFDAYQHCLDAAQNNDMRVATLDWMYMSMRRLGMDREADGAIADITPDTSIIENFSYHRRILMYRGIVRPNEVLPDAPDDLTALDLATQGYGVANFHLIEGRDEQAEQILRGVVEGDYWAAFGYIAAEADLRRLRDTGKIVDR